MKRIHFARLRTAVFLALIFTSNIFAIVIRHDRDDARYLALGAKYSGAIGRVTGIAESTLIAPEWALTAAHVAEVIGPFSRWVEFGDVRYEIEKIIIHPDWVKSGAASGRDIALLKLAKPVKGIAPVLLYSKDDEAGKTITFVGRGMTGNGLTGPVKDLKREMRGATNRIKSASETSIKMTFDAPPDGTELEGISGPGDSGGPALLEAGGKLYTLGVSSDNSGEGSEHCKYKTIETYTRVSTHRHWINETMKADLPSTLSWSSITRFDKNQKFPETPAGKTAAAFFSALNSADPAQLEKFNRDHRPESYLKSRTAEQLAQQARNMMERLGAVELYSYSQADPLTLIVLVYSKQAKEWQSYRFDLEKDAPNKLRAINLVRETAPTKTTAP